VSFLQPFQNLNVGAPPSSLGGAAPASGTLTGFSIQAQQHTEWCWAAVTTSVAVFFGSVNWTQCKVAAGELNLNCCGSDGPNGCNKPWYLDRPLARVGHLDRLLPQVIPMATVQQEILADRPIGCRIAWAQGSAHFVAIGGWSTDPDGTDYVDAYDPAHGLLVQKTYADFVSSYSMPGDSWTHTYFTLRSAGAAGGALPGVISPKSE